jgi:hypothetical protein
MVPVCKPTREKKSAQRFELRTDCLGLPASASPQTLFVGIFDLSLGRGSGCGCGAAAVRRRRCICLRRPIYYPRHRPTCPDLLRSQDDDDSHWPSAAQCRTATPSPQHNRTNSNQSGISIGGTQNDLKVESPLYLRRNSK